MKQNKLEMTAFEIAERLVGTDAGRLLLDPWCAVRSYCNASDTLDNLGLYNGDDQLTDLGHEVRDVLKTLYGDYLDRLAGMRGA